jgi:hypothetical protein
MSGMTLNSFQSEPATSAGPNMALHGLAAFAIARAARHAHSARH